MMLVPLKIINYRPLRRFLHLSRLQPAPAPSRKTQIGGCGCQSYQLLKENTRLKCTSAETKAGKEDVVMNPCNIQMIPDELYDQIFIDTYRQKSYHSDVISKCKNHLDTHGLWNKSTKTIDPVRFTLPELQGEDINDHFRNIALQQTFRYKKLMTEISSSPVPPKPKLWKFVSGWTKYELNGDVVSVPYPDESALIFDVEVSVTSGNEPTLACALSPTGWYSWCSEDLIKGESSRRNEICLNDLIPLETDQSESSVPNERLVEKIIIGHNVSYDRARVKEPYFLKGTKLRFLDTMSLHIAISGITSYQRALKLTETAGKKTTAPKELMKMGLESSVLEWGKDSSLNNLADVYKLYCNGELNKESRNIFVKGTLQDIQKDFQSLATYCAGDVEATKNIFSKLLPLYFERFPHPVTLSGMLEMGTTFLPVNNSWNEYIKKSENTFYEYEAEIKAILMEKAKQALKLLEGEKYKTDPWLWDLDWSVPKRKSKSSQETAPLPAWYRKLLPKTMDKSLHPSAPGNVSTSMRLVPKLLRLTWFGFPLHHSSKGGWGFLYKKTDESDQDSNSSTDEVEKLDTNNNEEDQQSDTDELLFPYEQWERLWEQANQKLLQRTQIGKVSETTGHDFRDKPELSSDNLSDLFNGLQALAAVGLWSKKEKKSKIKASHECSPHANCVFIPLPHKDGPDNRVGNPLSKDFLAKIEEGVLASAEEENDFANKVVTLSKTTSYWKNNRDRIMNQMTVWFQPDQVSFPTGDNESPDIKHGVILPQVAVAGTLTRRAVEPTWMTASNAYEDRIGSELKGMVQAPPSHHFVGADVDSQELWIASIIGDASFTCIHGSTALGWMTLQGNKNDGTDMHSKTASLIGIGRDQAKILNYGRIYGAGVNFAERLLQQFNRQLSQPEARNKAHTMYKMTKGERKYVLNEQGKKLSESLGGSGNGPFSRKEIRVLLSNFDLPMASFMEFVDKMAWDGGTESQMFNRLEGIAQDECPKTPILHCCISRALVPSVVHNDFMTSRVNWVVQSSAVDYLHLMLTCMKWLIDKYNIDARLSISVHDEVRYLVKSEDRFRAALALQITNLLTRSVCAYQMEMYDLPMSVSFFSCVDIDKVLRKEVTQDCVTPSNPEGLKKGYGIPLGEGLNINEVLKLTDGSLRVPARK